MPSPLRNRLIFIRHGETDWNKEGRLQGQQDIPLNPRGRDQASAVGRLVRRWLGAEADSYLDGLDYWCSPLGRTRETMDRALIAMGRPGQAYAFDDRLKELSFGQWEGLTWADVKPIDPEALKRRKADKWGFVPPGGESYAMLEERVRPWLDVLDGDALVVAHGGVARTLLHMLGGVPADEAVDMDIHQGRALVFEGDGFRWV